MMIRAILLSFSFLFLSSMCVAQDVVVSEYYNDVAQDREWSEFFVIKDNLNMVGYIFTDNRGTQDQRQSGPMFLDLPIWRNVRAGTIIVIHHDALPPSVKLDTNAADGFVEISQIDTRFFRMVNVEAAPSSTGMNINADRDFVQVLRPDTSHVHGLGHGRPLGPTYLGTPDPKANHDTSNMGTSRSVGITGRSILAYNAGFGKDSTSSGLFTSRGLPNLVDNTKLLAGVKNVNHRFWRETREPKFLASPSVTLLSQTATKHVIEWTQVSDPFPADSTTGYVVLRDTLDFTSFPPNAIVDGSAIVAGQRFGSAVVLAVQPTAIGNRYSDSLNLQCNIQYTYRVYAYRYRADDNMTLAQTVDTTARGRQYNENVYAQSSKVLKPSPAKPIIFSARQEICPGDTLTIATNTAGATKYEWTVNGVGVPVGGTTSVLVRAPGTYRLKIFADGGCFAESDPLVISALPAPTVIVSPVGTQTICVGDTLTISSVTDGASYQWLLNGNPIPGATGRTFKATSIGDYQVRIATNQGCPGLSSVVKIRVPDVRYSFSPSTLDFGSLGACQNSSQLVTEISNDGTEPITISQFNVPVGFAITQPAPGFVVLPGQKQVVRVLFAPPSTGTFSGDVVFSASPCGIQEPFSVTGKRTVATAALDKAGVNFGTYTICPATDVRPDSAIRVTNSGASTITITAPLVSPPFYLLTQFLSEQLPAGASKLIRFQYRPLGADLDKGVIQEIGFPFVSSDCNDTLRATLEAASFKPKVSFDTASLDLGLVLSCNTAIDTLIEVFNSGLIPIVVESTSKGIILGGIEILGSPITISPGTSKTIRIRAVIQPVPGNFTLNDTLLLSPCGLKAPIQFTGRVVAPSVSISPASISFGSIDRCSGRSDSTQSVTVTVAGLGGLRANVSVVKISAPFQTSASVGNFIVDNETFTVTYRPQADGNHIDTLVLVVGPCFDTVRCIVQGARTSPGVTTRLSNANFGLLAAGQSRQETYTVNNTGTSAITVEPLQGVIAPWSIVGVSKPVPAVVQPADSIVFTLAYSFTGYGRSDSLSITSIVSGLCADTSTFTITGSTIQRGVLSGISLVIADTSSGAIGSVVKVPVSLQSTMALDSSSTKQIKVYVSYNGSVLALQGVSDFGNGLSGSISTITPQRSELTLNSTQAIKDTGYVFSILAKVYLGNALFSDVTVDSVIATGMVITGVPGKVTVIGDCAIETKTIALGKPASIVFRGIRNSGLEFDVVTNTDLPASIDLYQVDGRLIAMLANVTVKPGEHAITTAMPAHATGACIVVFKHGRYIQSIPLLLKQD